MQRRAVNLNVHAFCCGAEFKWRTSGENRILDEWEYQVDQVEGLREAELQDQEEMEVEEINWQYPMRCFHFTLYFRFPYHSQALLCIPAAIRIYPPSPLN